MHRTDPLTKIQKHWFSFGVVFLLVFTVTASIGSVVQGAFFGAPAPKAPKPAVANNTQPLSKEVPVSIKIPSIDIETTIYNPTDASIETLDSYLLKGAVRYPGSALLGEKGNVLIFGHSSYLPVVRNQAYKAFNDIQNLRKDDSILVYSDEKVYTFGVESVEKVSAKSTEEIELDSKNNVLTLVTCNTFGDKSDRFLVTATLRSVDPIDN